MKRSFLKLAPAMGCVLLGALSASAATITNFSASYLGNPQYQTTPLTATFSGSTALVTNTAVTCISEASCSGQLLQFSIQGTGIDPSQLVSVGLDGNLSGTTSGSGTLSLSVFGIPTNRNFSFAAGNFNSSILSTTLPLTGAFSASGTLSLNLQSGQVLTLPSSLSLTLGTPASTVPEPGSLALLGTGLSGLVFVIQKRRLHSR